MIINGERYRGTEGLWELVTMKKTKTIAYDGEDIKKYKEITVETGATRNRKNPQKPASNKGQKWEIFIRPIWEKHVKAPKRNVNRKKQGLGFLPSDPNDLCERLELLMASKQAGNTGLRNEIVSICDELLRQKILSRDTHKNLMLTLNEDVNY